MRDATIDPAAALGVLDLLYQTLDEPDAWQEWLDRCCSLLRADGGNIAFISNESPGASVFLQNYVSADQLRTYTEKYIELDWQRAQLDALPVGTPMCSSMVSPTVLQDYFDSQYFQEFSRDTPQYMSLGGYFIRNADIKGSSGFHRRSLDDPFLPSDVTFVAALHRHLARIMQQSAYIELLEDAVRICARGTEGIILLDAAAQVVYSNAGSADALRCGGLRIDGRTISAERPQDNARLNAAIAHVLSMAPGTATRSCELLIGRRPPAMPLAVSVAPNDRKRPFQAAHAACVRAVVRIVDPNRAPELRENFLEQLYGLTRRQVDIARALATGAGLKSIAESMGMSHETARTHAKAVYQKTGTKGQAQLAAMLAVLGR